MIAADTLSAYGTECVSPKKAKRQKKLKINSFDGKTEIFIITLLGARMVKYCVNVIRVCGSCMREGGTETVDGGRGWRTCTTYKL